MRETIEALIVLGLLGLLIVLRFDARRFGVAEYDDSARDGSWRAWVRRLAWFTLGIALVLMVYWLYPQPVSVLHLDIGGTAGGADRGRAMFYGLLIGVAGIFAAAVYAWGRYGGIRLPAPRAYPAAFINSVGTAIVDEATFRGILLGLLLHAGLGSWVPIGIAAAVYGVATRLTARGRSKGMLVIDLMLAVATGWSVVETGGIGAAILGHAITRFAIFLLTGHTDQSRPFGTEPENVAGRALPPKGWEMAGRTGGTRPWTTNVVGIEGAIPGSISDPTHAGESPFAGQGYVPAAPIAPRTGSMRTQAIPATPGVPMPPPYMGPPPGPGPHQGVAPDGSWGPQEPWSGQPPGGYLPPEGMPPPPPAYDDAQGGGRRG
jgi:hypothetical protein